MAAVRKLTFLLCLSGSNAISIRADTAVMANPIRRVVTMMQNMQKQVQEEGKRDQDLFDKFMCYCSTGRSELEGEISAAETKIPQVESALKEGQEQKTQLQADLKQHKQDRADAQGALAKANELRKKEAAAYDKESSDFNANIAAMGKAIAALEKGASGFLQSSGAQVVRRLSVDMDISSTDRDLLTSFLTEGQGSGYAPQSGQIIGILKQMKDTMDSELSEATASEKDSIATFNGLAAAKEKEIAANSKAIEAKTKRLGEVGVEVVNMQEDLDDTTESLAEDQKFLADLSSNCKTAEGDFAEVKKTRAAELLALAETIKILNDDDALDLFKKTLPTPSLLQTKVTQTDMTNKAINLLHSVKGKNPHLDLIMLALRGKKVSFDKVIKMIDEMVALLKTEQQSDDGKKAYCEAQIDKTEDEHKALVQEGEDLAKAIKDGNGMLETLTEEIAALAKGIKDLDAQVAEATSTRKEENEEYKQTMAADNAAKELLKKAKNRMNQFYNPKLAKPEAASFVQFTIRTHRKDAPPPPPEAVGAYQTKGQESNGVIVMMDALIADLDKEIQEMTTEENDSQKEYEQLIQDSADKRAADAKSLAEKEGAKADLEIELEKTTQEKKAKLMEEMAKAEYLGDVHKECDWLLQNYGVRKDARDGEVESLKNAKAVLSGADFSF